MFLKSALVWDEFSVSRHGRLTSGEKKPYPLERRLAERQDRSGRSGEEKNLAPIDTWTPIPRPSSQ
jgi:hypothetical protein